MTTPALEAPTLVEAIERAASGAGAAVFHLEGGEVRLSAKELLEGALTVAADLRVEGIGPGDRVGILGPNRPAWLRAAYGVWAAGATLVPLPFHLRIKDPEAFAEQTASLVAAAGCRLVLADPRFLPALPSSVGRDWASSGRPGGRRDLTPVSEDDIAVIQFTSGSTSAPKGAMLCQRGVVTAVRMATQAQRVEPGVDRYLGWLPFFHDWGLFGYAVRPILAGCESHLLPTERFAAAPSRWLRLAGEVRATLTSGPASGYRAAFSQGRRHPEGIDLSTLRFCEIGAEAIDPDTVDLMIDAGRSFGLRPEALGGGYGLAEATLGLALSRVDQGIRIDEVDLERLTREGRAVPARGGSTKRVVSCGAPLPGATLRIRGPEGDLPERRVGEIQARSPAVMIGYFGEGVEQPFQEGWLCTGDLGYLAGGELYVVGRSKEIIIAYGQNHAPQDIEWAAERVEGVRPGRVVAFAGSHSPEGEVLVVLEPGPNADLAALPGRVRQSVSDAIGIGPRQVLLVAKGAIPKTTSGKLRRSAVREAYERGTLPILEPPPRS